MRDTPDLPDDDYLVFIRGKVEVAREQGILVDLSEVNPALKEHVRLVVPWLLRGGCRALFSQFGMQKTSTQLELMRLILAHVAGAECLIVIPLGVRQEFVRDAAERFTGKYAIDVKFIRSHHDAVGYCREAEAARDVPTLFDLMTTEQEELGAADAAGDDVLSAGPGVSPDASSLPSAPPADRNSAAPDTGILSDTQRRAAVALGDALADVIVGAPVRMAAE